MKITESQLCKIRQVEREYIAWISKDCGFDSPEYWEWLKANTNELENALKFYRDKNLIDF